MKNLTIGNIVKAVSGQLHTSEGYDEKREALSVVIDSRKASEGCVFIALRGERVDGHNFISDVFKKGALAVICEEVPDELDGPCIQVDDCYKAIKSLAGFYRQQLNVKIVGIIGSVGKTSTKELVASVLSVKYDVHKTAGNFNNEVGVPLTIFAIEDHHEIAVVEMGISDFGEMDRLGTIVEPDVVVMTNIGPCHLEKLIDLDGVLKAKTEVFKHMPESGIIVLNHQDEKLRTITSEYVGARQIRYYNGGGEVFGTDPISFGLEGTSFMLHINEKKMPVKVPIPGKHMVDNAVAAALVGEIFDMTPAEIQSGIGQVKALNGRSRLIRSENYLVVDDCYNANPKSMMAAVDLMQDAKGRKVMILGDMFELGEDSDMLHAKVGEYAAMKDIDLIICVGKSSESMYNAAMKVIEDERKFIRAVHFESKEQLMAALSSDRTLLETGDTVLIKASHGMGFTEVVDLLSGSKEL